MLHSKKIRDQKGAAITGLVIALMLFILMAGLFAFDASRVQMAQRELTATCDAAALAGTAMLTSYDVSNDPGLTKLANAQQNAAAYAYNMFQMGNVLGRFLNTNTSLVPDLASLTTTTDGEAKVVIGLVDPLNSFATVDPTPPGNANGRAIAVFAGYGYHPVFISFYGVGNVGIRASSIGGLPQVDAILVFDYSGSMDDLTKVTLIKRWWNPFGGLTASFALDANGTDSMGWNTRQSFLETEKSTNPTNFVPGAAGSAPFNYVKTGKLPGLVSNTDRGCIQYDEAPHPSTNQSLLKYIDHNSAANIQGQSLNVLPPQNLVNSETDVNLSGHDLIVYKAYLRHALFSNDVGSPPGNCPAHRQAAGGAWTSVVGNSYAWADPLTDHFRYPAYSSNGGLGNSLNGPQMDDPGDPWNTNLPVHTAPNIYTDLVVNIANPGSYPYQQPLDDSGNDVFSGFSYTFPGYPDEPDSTIAGQQYDFANIAVVVEAARGNLDTQANLDGTGLHRGYFLNASGVSGYQGPTANMTVKAGYQKAYQRLAMLWSQPIATALDGADQGFFQKLGALADCRFGFVGFSDSDPFGAAPNVNSMATPHSGIVNGAVGTSQYRAKSSYYIDVAMQPSTLIGTTIWDGRHVGSEARIDENNDVQNPSGLPGFRVPRTPLDTSNSQQESLDIVTKGSKTGLVPWSNPTAGDGLYNGRPLSGTMCAEALRTARLEFQAAAYDGLSRAGSKRAIIFFTDGIPSGGVPGGSGGYGGTEANDSWTEADSCRTDGIAIFSIGLNMLDDPTLKSDQNIFLGNSSTGLSGRAKNGGRFFECSSVSSIKESFSAVVRRLTQSQR
ncbi:MAG: VWA domain-containing protein [Candidatus Melainabacteria bacterium]|nr:VWA domain-containing protein [Candidatus Melainabacteria bacterium]